MPSSGPTHLSPMISPVDSGAWGCAALPLIYRISMFVLDLPRVVQLNARSRPRPASTQPSSKPALLRHMTPPRDTTATGPKCTKQSQSQSQSHRFVCAPSTLEHSSSLLFSRLSLSLLSFRCIPSLISSLLSATVSSRPRKLQGVSARPPRLKRTHRS